VEYGGEGMFLVGFKPTSFRSLSILPRAV